MEAEMRKQNYQDRLRTLGLAKLQVRRTRRNLVEVYKMMTERVNKDREQCFQLAGDVAYMGLDLEEIVGSSSLR